MNAAIEVYDPMPACERCGKMLKWNIRFFVEKTAESRFTHIRRMKPRR